MLDRLISAQHPTAEASHHVAPAPTSQYMPDYAPCLVAPPYLHGYPAPTAALQYAPDYMPMIAPPHVPETNLLPLERAMNGYGAQTYEADRMAFLPPHMSEGGGSRLFPGPPPAPQPESLDLSLGPPAVVRRDEYSRLQQRESTSWRASA